ncbi:MAG: low molecular weight phosphotyrosine protein phosphatase [Acidothermus cellulolyticus]|nr:low molecular weight phosphotyrosine protein phosphatase [Acidothermus cellulolyticus]
MATVVTRQLLAERGLADAVQVSSAGTGDWHVGEPMDERTAAVLRRRGYDGAEIARHRARRFEPGWFDEYDLILAVDEENLRALQRRAAAHQRGKIRLLREFDPLADGDVDVPDPYYGGPEGFDTVLAMIERSCAALVDELERRLTARSAAPTNPAERPTEAADAGSGPPETPRRPSGPRPT